MVAVARAVSVPAPVGGLNARDSIADMPATDAIKLDNWFCTPTTIQLRNGSSNYVTGLPGWVETLIPYNPPTGTPKLFAASGGNIYDVTTAGAVGAALVTGNTSNRWQFTTIGTPGGYFLFACNGVDLAQVYNGTTWQQLSSASTPLALTGIATSSLIYPTVFKQRLYAIQANTLKFWYLGVSSIAGAAASFDLSAQFKLGGYLVAMYPWSAGQPDNPQNYLAFLSSMGEVVVYQGFDPTQFGLFTLAMTFRVGRPIGQRPLIPAADDLLVISADGVTELRTAMSVNESSQGQSLSYKIINLLNNDVQIYGKNFGWQLLLYPIGNKLIVNVPQAENSQQYQYVMNTITKTWSRWTGLNAACWELLGDNLFYGGNGVVVQADTGNNDNGVSILGDVKPAFSYFETPGKNKQVTLVRPVFTADDAFTTTATLNTNFSDNPPSSAIQFPTTTSKPVWNVALWNVSSWTSGTQTYTRFQAVGGIGYTASLRLQVASSKANVSLLSIDYLMKDGGLI